MKHWEHCQMKGMDLIATLRGEAAQHVFKFDTSHLQTSDAVVSVGLPGKSASWELGYAYGLGKPTFVLHEGVDPERLDVMLAGATIVRSVDQLEQALRLQLGLQTSGYLQAPRNRFEPEV
jgi:nucleoside 2-deoxyribosyltransferase